MQCRVVSCSPTQCHAVPYSVMQCHAVSCSVMQCHAVPCCAMQSNKRKTKQQNQRIKTSNPGRAWSQNIKIIARRGLPGVGPWVRLTSRAVCCAPRAVGQRRGKQQLALQNRCDVISTPAILRVARFRKRNKQTDERSRNAVVQHCCLDPEGRPRSGTPGSHGQAAEPAPQRGRADVPEKAAAERRQDPGA